MSPNDATPVDAAPAIDDAPSMSARLQLDAFLPYQLSVTSNAVSRAIASTYAARFGLKIPEWRVLAVLAEAAALSPRDLGARTEMDKMTVSRAAAGLAGRGLVARAADAGDRRSHRLELTPAGRALHAEVAPLALALEAQLLDGLGAGELAALRASLAKLKAAVLDVKP